MLKYGKYFTLTRLADTLMSVEKKQINISQTKLRRSKGERTREKILLSAIEILATHGIKGTTHRAIASHADIQLSLTTYYFKDIQELVQQAFELNSSLMRASTDNILQKAFNEFENIDKASLRKVSVKTELCERLSQMTAQHLFNHVENNEAALAVEQLMYTSVQVTPKLQQLAKEHEESQLVPFAVLAKYFNNKDPEIDANIMRTIFTQLEYSQLPLKPSERSIEPIQLVTRKLLRWIMGLKN